MSRIILTSVNVICLIFASADNIDLGLANSAYPAQPQPIMDYYLSKLLVVCFFQGPLTVCIQELDGSFKHTVQIEDSLSHHELQCHSKSRRYVLCMSPKTSCEPHYLEKCIPHYYQPTYVIFLK